MALTITDSNFETEVLKSEKVSIIDFWAEWCGPCKVVGPIVEELANDYADKAVVGKVNVDDNPDVTTRFGIRNIPTLVFIKNGVEVERHVGAAPKAVLEDKLKKHL